MSGHLVQKGKFLNIGDTWIESLHGPNIAAVSSGSLCLLSVLGLEASGPVFVDAPCWLHW